MLIINYLNKNFYTLNQLLNYSKLDLDTFRHYQKDGLMPLYSYRLQMDYKCSSFLSEAKKKEDIEFYSKGYVTWLSMLEFLDTKEKAFKYFKNEYTKTIKELAVLGLSSNEEKLTKSLDEHINQEWNYFLDGSYGLCTKSGLVKDIAIKEVAISCIKELEKDIKGNIDNLTLAVDLLDNASALFAPHERENSSRVKIIERLRSQILYFKGR